MLLGKSGYGLSSGFNELTRVSSDQLKLLFF
jgi:hypothetical protein